MAAPSFFALSYKLIKTKRTGKETEATRFWKQDSDSVSGSAPRAEKPTLSCWGAPRRAGSGARRGGPEGAPGAQGPSRGSCRMLRTQCPEPTIPPDRKQDWMSSGGLTSPKAWASACLPLPQSDWFKVGPSSQVRLSRSRQIGVHDAHQGPASVEMGVQPKCQVGQHPARRRCLTEDLHVEPWARQEEHLGTRVGTGGYQPR